MAEFNRLTESGTVVKSPEYWARRSEWIEQQGFKDVDKANRRIVNGYNTVLKDIEQDIADHLTKYPDINHRVTLKEYLTEMDDSFTRLKNLNKSLEGTDETYRKLFDGKIKALTDRINNTNTARNITALEMLDQQLRVRLSEFGVDASKQMSQEFKQVYEQTYDRKQFTIQRGVGYGYLYRKPDWKAVEKAINYPWAEDGSMWSERIWNYVDMEAKNFVKGVRKAIVSDALLQGKNPSRIAKELVGFANPTLSPSQMKFNLSRLLQTEATHILGEAQAEVSNEWGLTHYTYLATLDERTSPICQSLDGETFAYKDRKTGVNFPPMHPLCRSTVYDVVPDAIYTNRASRDATGKTVQEVPADVTYAQWKEWQKTGKKSWETKFGRFDKLIKEAEDSFNKVNAENTSLEEILDKYYNKPDGDRTEWREWRKTIDIEEVQKRATEVVTIRKKALETLNNLKSLNVSEDAINVVRNLKTVNKKVSTVKKQFTFSDGTSDRGNKFTKPATITTNKKGVNFIYPDSYDHTKQAVELKQALNVFDRLPEQLQSVVKNVEFVDYFNPRDEHWERVYNIKGFTSDAIGGNGGITFFRNKGKTDSNLLGVYAHESAHNLDQEISKSLGLKTRFSESDAYKHITNLDKSVGGKQFLDGYASESKSFAEDFAEAVNWYITNPDKLKTDFPNRFELIERMFGND